MRSNVYEIPTEDGSGYIFIRRADMRPSGRPPFVVIEFGGGEPPRPVRANQAAKAMFSDLVTRNTPWLDISMNSKGNVPLLRGIAAWTSLVGTLQDLPDGSQVVLIGNPHGVNLALFVIAMLAPPHGFEDRESFFKMRGIDTTVDPEQWEWVREILGKEAASMLEPKVFHDWPAGL